MRNLALQLVLIWTLGGNSVIAFSQENHVHTTPSASSALNFIYNKGQWQKEILFKAAIENGSVYLEKDGFTFAQYNRNDLDLRHDFHHKDKKAARNLTLHGHAWKTTFVGSNLNQPIEGRKKIQAYNNYFIGKDESKWAGEVPLFNETYYSSVYDRIDLKVYSEELHFKYDFIVAAGGNPKNIQLKYEGLNSMELENGNLILVTSVGEFKEIKPYAYQWIGGQKKEVLAAYTLHGNQVGFVFPNGFDTSFELIIDPVLVAATLSGTSVFNENYGHCATFDNAGNIYTGAINFDDGYPSTLGAFQIANAGGFNDIAISKLNPTGTSLLFATYLGGSDDDFPHSLIVNGSNELFVYGTTSSSNFPITAGAFDNSLTGITDMIISHFNTTGSALIGSTYVGGSDIDGSNILTTNYGDGYRGEIILDAMGNCYIAGTTSSTNFPTTPGAYQTVFGGITDAVFFKMNASLTNLIWSTLLGGTDEESGFGLRLDSAGDIYACGAGYGNFMVANGYQTTSGGQIDGFVVKITGNGTAMPNRTYFGTPFTDNTFFIDIDNLGRINIYGQCDGTYLTSTAGTYSVAGSGQYVACLSPALTTLNFLSLIGSGGGGDEFVPIAFMVDNCGYIYFSGHSVSTSTLTNTVGALQTSGGFYLGVLTPNATSIHYATHYGGAADHVDGGTSRFDPSGTVYQGVCTGAGFNTLPGAYSSAQPGGWDVGVFKINFEVNSLQASADLTPSNTGCAPLTVNFNNTSSGINYVWDFGDGSPISTLVNPTHTFTTVGTYNVMLIAIDSSLCNIADTAYYSIDVLSSSSIDLGPDTTICAGTSFVLDAGSSSPYLWQDGSTNQTFTVTGPGTYYVTAGNGICVATDTVVVTLGPLTVNLGPDLSICNGGSVVLNAGNPGATYVWSDGSTAQTLTVFSQGTYYVDVANGSCLGSDTVLVTSAVLTPLFSVTDTIGCSPVITKFTDLSTASVPITSWLWNFGDGGSSTLQNTTHNYTVSGAFLVSLTITTSSGCSSTYTRTITVQLTPTPVANFTFNPFDPKPEQEVHFIDQSTNATSWYWSFGDGNTSILQNPIHLYESINNFDVTLIVQNAGCIDSIHRNILFEEELIFYVPNAFTPDGDAFNNTFDPIFSSGIKPLSYKLTIYDRWGEVIFESNDLSIGWDGTFENRLVQEGVYTWKIYFSRSNNDDKQNVLGHVTVLR